VKGIRYNKVLVKFIKIDLFKSGAKIQLSHAFATFLSEYKGFLSSQPHKFRVGQ
jgi:hypothetical protein